MSSRLTTREVIDNLNRVFDCQVPAIEKRGGEVLKFMGDGLLAIFPLAESDDASQSPTVRSPPRRRPSPRSRSARRLASASRSTSARSPTATSAARTASTSRHRSVGEPRGAPRGPHEQAGQAARRLRGGRGAHVARHRGPRRLRAQGRPRAGPRARAARAFLSAARASDPGRPGSARDARVLRLRGTLRA